MIRPIVPADNAALVALSASSGLFRPDDMDTLRWLAFRTTSPTAMEKPHSLNASEPESFGAAPALTRHIFGGYRRLPASAHSFSMPWHSVLAHHFPTAEQCHCVLPPDRLRCCPTNREEPGFAVRNRPLFLSDCVGEQSLGFGDDVEQRFVIKPRFSALLGPDDFAVAVEDKGAVVHPLVGFFGVRVKDAPFF